LKPMLAHVFEEKRWVGGPCWLQPKFNGVRALYQGGRFQSRDELPWAPAVLAHLSEPLLAMFPDDRTILDGELYVHGWPLQRINGAVAINRTAPIPDTLEVSYYVFDSVSFTKPFFVRFGEVEGTIRQLQHPRIHAATTVQPPSREWVEEFYAHTVADGFEGIMYRVGLCPYTQPKQPRQGERGFMSDKNNRVWHLLKRKSWMDEEFECVGVEEGEGKRAGMVGSFICQSFHNFPAGYVGEVGTRFNVGSGLTDSEAKHYFDNPPIGRKIKVKFLTYTTGGIPFNPTVEAVL
jgi:ATP-dependent DNA ligase